MTRRDEVLQLLADGKTQAEAAAELGISQSRVSQLRLGRTGNESRQRTGSSTNTSQPDATPAQSGATASSQAVVQPGATASSQPVFVQPETVTANTVQPDDEAGQFIARLQAEVARLTAERDELRAKTAKMAPRWDAMVARIAELEAAPAAGPCPGCADRDAAYEQLEAELTDARRQLFAYEEA